MLSFLFFSFPGGGRERASKRRPACAFVQSGVHVHSTGQRSGSEARHPEQVKKTRRRERCVLFLKEGDVAKLACNLY